MKGDSHNREFKRGATRLGVLDVLTALILLALLLWASWEQFPAYHDTPLSPSASTAPASNQ
jgi:hypothetical protein